MFYPMMINLENKRVVIVGGGKVALRKTKKLLSYSCHITVVSPILIDDFKEIRKDINIIEEKYKHIYIENSFMVIAATSSSEVNMEVAKYCKKEGILCNVVDNKEMSDFIVPSSVKRGDLTISISTGGNSPALSAKIRKEIEKKYTEEYQEYVEELGLIRELVLEKCEEEEERRQILRDLLKLDIKELKRRRVKYENRRRI